MHIQFAFPERIDRRITALCRSLWRTHAWLDAWMITVAKWTPIVMLLLIAFEAGPWFVPSTAVLPARIGAAASVVAAVVARGLNEPIARAVSRRRPFQEMNFVPLLSHANGEGFPSNHATGAFALAMGSLATPGYGWLLLCLAVILSVSRVYCGLHYASDVWFGALHGLVVGSIAATVCFWLF